MTREEFDVLVQKLEKVARKHPRLYTARLVGLVLLAYGYLFLVLIGSFVLTLAMLAMIIRVPASAKFGIVGMVAFGGIFLAILRGLWVRLEPPVGPEITRAQAPKLFALLDELRAALNCRPFHKVLVISDLNAAVIQIPRLGILGWHKNYLLLGLPLMQSLAPDEFKAVLAHEFAHSSRGHGRFGNWLYRVRRTWQQVFEQMARQRTRFSGVLYKFINWFWPIFNGHAFVLARANEYEADACSVRLAGADVAASALMRLPVNDTLLGEKFWPDIFVRANSDKEPPADVMLSLNRALKDGLETGKAQKRLRQSFLMETNNADTHPCLKDRLRAMDRLPAGVESNEWTVVPPPVPEQSAADVLLGDYTETLARRLSDDWRQMISNQWAARHAHAQKLANELAALEKPEDTPPTAADLWEKASKLITLHSDAKALPVIEQVLALDPKHPAANFVLGRHRLEADDSSGVALVEAAMDADMELTRNGCELLYGYYHRNGQRDKIKLLEKRMDRFQEIAAQAQQERARIRSVDTFVPHGLSEEEIDNLRKIFMAEPEIGMVAVVRKAVEHFKKSPCFVIGLDVKVPWWKPRSSSADAKLVNRVLKQVGLPGQFTVFVKGKKLQGLWAKITSVDGSSVYARKV